MKNQIPSLNGLRAISILLVIASHYKKNYAFTIAYPFGFFFNGHFGVNIFFIISGFLITKLLLSEESTNGKISLANFYKRRTLRIFPAYYFLLIVYAFMQFFHLIYLDPISWITSIFYLKYFYMTGEETLHFWSLSVEEHFYLLYPPCFVYFRKHLTKIAWTVIILVPIIRIIGYIKNYSQFSLFQRADALMIGCLIALHEQRINAVIERLSWKINPSLSVLILITSILGLYGISYLNFKYPLHLGFFTVPFGDPFGTLSSFLIGMLMLFSIKYRNAWYTFLNFPVMDYIGKLSYSLYLWQEIFAYPPAKLPLLKIMPISLVCLFITANFSYFCIEKPFLRLKKRYSTSNKAYLKPDMQRA